MHSTGAGKVLLLNYSGPLLEGYVESKGLPAFTEHTITTSDEFLAEIEAVKHRGFAYDNQECEVGVRCVAFPIKDFSGKNIAAISVSAPITRLSPEKEARVIQVLQEVSRRASEDLGWKSTNSTRNGH